MTNKRYVSVSGKTILVLNKLMLVIYTMHKNVHNFWDPKMLQRLPKWRLCRFVPFHGQALSTIMCHDRLCACNVSQYQQQVLLADLRVNYSCRYNSHRQRVEISETRASRVVLHEGSVEGKWWNIDRATVDFVSTVIAPVELVNSGHFVNVIGANLIHFVT